jgi:hypothetical protein
MSEEEAEGERTCRGGTCRVRQRGEHLDMRVEWRKKGCSAGIQRLEVQQSVEEGENMTERTEIRAQKINPVVVRLNREGSKNAFR